LNEIPIEEEDTVEPVITLNGDNPMELEVGEEYVEPGATAEDDVDGELTEHIKIDGKVITDEPGEYEVTYTVSDAAGNKATETRTVIVVEPDEDEDQEEEALKDVNDAVSAEAMQVGMYKQAMDLTVDDYNVLSADKKAEVAALVLENRPEDDEGYPLPNDIQAALDQAVDEVSGEEPEEPGAEGGTWFTGEGAPGEDL